MTDQKSLIAGFGQAGAFGSDEPTVKYAVRACLRTNPGVAADQKPVRCFLNPGASERLSRPGRAEPAKQLAHRAAAWL